MVHHSSHCNVSQCCLYGHTGICHIDNPETMIIHFPLYLKMTTSLTQCYGPLCWRLSSYLDILPLSRATYPIGQNHNFKCQNTWNPSFKYKQKLMDIIHRNTSRMGLKLKPSKCRTFSIVRGKTYPSYIFSQWSTPRNICKWTPQDSHLVTNNLRHFITSVLTSQTDWKESINYWLEVNTKFKYISTSYQHHTFY